MQTALIFLWVILGFISMAFWEAYIEGRHPWAGAQVGWKKKFYKHFSITAYHFWIYFMFFFFLTLPLIIYGWKWDLFGIIFSATCIGLVVEDFLWFIVNPFYTIKKDFNSKKAYWYPWIKIFRIEIPLSYIISFFLSFLSWYFLWR